MVGYYVVEGGRDITYVDPLADDTQHVAAPELIKWPAVVLMAHNRYITYGYTGQAGEDTFYFDIKPGSVVVDPWRRLPKDMPGVKEVIHYGNTRQV